MSHRDWAVFAKTIVLIHRSQRLADGVNFNVVLQFSLLNH